MQYFQHSNTFQRERYEIGLKLGQVSFSRVLILTFLIIFPVLVMAQASGGQITRKKQNKGNSVHNKRESIISPPSGYENGVPYVDLGLSVKWGYYNVGASVPEASGKYYAWGETESKTTYSWKNYFDSKNVDETEPERNYTFHIYNVNNGLKKISPNSGRDAARNMYGGLWRMPSRSECEELKEKCSWTQISYKGVVGYLVKADNGKSIFLPNSLSYEKYYGFGEVKPYGETYYWTSDLYTDFSSRAYSFHLRYDSLVGRLRYFGQLIRPVF